MYNLSNVSKRNVSQAKGKLGLPLVFGYLGVLFFSSLLLGCGNNTNDETVRVSQLNDILANSQHPCKEQLISVGNELIGDKEHLLQLEGLPSLAVDNEGDQKKETANNNTDTTNTDSVKTNTIEQLTYSSPLILSGVLLYKDRPSHVRFDASLINDKKTGNMQCLVGYQLNYQFKDPCMTVREEVFKKWNQIAQLNDNTRYYVHKRHPDRKAYLTNLDRNVQCLASVKDSQRFVLE